MTGLINYSTTNFTSNETQILNTSLTLDNYVTYAIPTSCGRISYHNGTKELAEEIEHLYAVRKSLLFAVQQICLPVIVIFGLLGNILNIIVLSRRWMKTSTNYYLMVLAVFDTLYLVFSLVLSLHHWQGVELSMSYYRARAYIRPMLDICNLIAVWITVTFTIERYIGVCMPMRGRMWCTPERARYVIVAVIIIGTGVVVPEFFEFEKNPTRKCANQRTPFGYSDAYNSYDWFHLIISLLLPLAALVVFNTLLVRTVWASTRIRLTITSGSTDKRNKRQQSEQQRITTMLISVVVVFIICQTPAAVMTLYRYFLEFNNDKHIVLYKIAANFANLLLQINAAINFILYSYFSNRFRKTCQRLFCGIHDKRRSTFMENTSHHTQMTAVRKSSPFITPNRSPSHSPKCSPSSYRTPIFVSDGKETHRLSIPNNGHNGYQVPSHGENVYV